MQLLARVRGPNAVADLGPVNRGRDAVGEPAGVVLDGVVEVDPVHDGAAGASLGGGVGKDDEEDEGRDHEEHDPQVHVHQEGVAVAGARDARQRHHHHGQAYEDERPLQEPHAVGAARAAAQPYAAAYDGKGEEEAQEVEESD